MWQDNSELNGCCQREDTPTGANSELKAVKERKAPVQLRDAEREENNMAAWGCWRGSRQTR